MFKNGHSSHSLLSSSCLRTFFFKLFADQPMISEHLVYVLTLYLTNKAFYVKYLKGNIYNHVVLQTLLDCFYDNWWSICIKWKEWKRKIKHLLTTFSFFITWQFTKFYSIYQHIEIQTGMGIFSSKFINKMKNRSHLS